MNDLACDEMLPLLSAYYDGELPESKLGIVTEHLQDCHRCRETLSSYRAISGLAAHMTQPNAPDRWGELEAELVTSPHGQRSMVHKSRRPISLVAALLLVAIGFGIWGWRSHQTHHLEMNFDGFLTRFAEDPQRAEQLLISQYQGRAVNFDQAVEELHYRPAVVDHMPSGYQLVSANLLKMPCCQCLQATFKGPTGKPICVFEHDLDQPVWFGDRACIDAICNGKKCRLIQVDGTVAATWQRAKRFITVIGPQNLDEMVKLIAQLDKDQPSTPDKSGL